MLEAFKSLIQSKKKNSASIEEHAGSTKENHDIKVEEAVSLWKKLIRTRSRRRASNDGIKSKTIQDVIKETIRLLKQK